MGILQCRFTVSSHDTRNTYSHISAAGKCFLGKYTETPSTYDMRLKQPAACEINSALLTVLAAASARGGRLDVPQYSVVILRSIPLQAAPLGSIPHPELPCTEASSSITNDV